jgi:xanthine dehydrogenase YagT iron-sulfur-binding subunit
MAPKKKDEPGFSRRTFLKTVGAGGVAAGVLGPATGAEAQPVNAVGPAAAPIQLNVNGKVHRLEVEPRVTLLDALRTRLGVTGPKRVCDRGSCGACTVIIEGRTMYSCSMLAIEALGKPIRTVEGLTEGTVLHPVQQAFCERDGLMCGFCTPGFITATAALLEKNPKPTREQARKALDGNICRCGTYVRVLEAALDPKSAAGVRRG